MIIIPQCVVCCPCHDQSTEQFPYRLGMFYLIQSTLFHYDLPMLGCTSSFLLPLVVLFQLHTLYWHFMCLCCKSVWCEKEDQLYNFHVAFILLHQACCDRSSFVPQHESLILFLCGSFCKHRLVISPPSFTRALLTSTSPSRSKHAFMATVMFLEKLPYITLFGNDIICLFPSASTRMRGWTLGDSDRGGLGSIMQNLKYRVFQWMFATLLYKIHMLVTEHWYSTQKRCSR